MIGPEVNAPDLTEAVIGYRRFHLERRSQHNYHLVSPHSKEPWPTVERTAKCNKTISSENVVLDGIRPRQHSAPQKDCGCGIYAYFDPCPIRDDRDAWLYYTGPRPTEIEALVTMTGRIEVHSRGMRSQRARICALGSNSLLSEDEKAGLAMIAEAFGVPVVKQGELPKLACEYGSPVPDSLRPDQPKPTPAKSPSSAPKTALEMVFDAKPKRQRLTGWIALHSGIAAMNIACWGVLGTWYVSIPGAVVSTWFAGWNSGRQREMNRGIA